MRRIEVSKEEFDDFLYPAIGSSAAENESELETALRVMRKLKDPSITFEEDINPQEQERAAQNRQKLIPLKKLRVDHTEFVFEEDEHKLVVARLKSYIPRITLLAAEELYGLIKRVVGAREEAKDRDATEMPAPKINR